MATKSQPNAELAALIERHGAYVGFPAAAEITTLSVRTLKRLVDRGDLPGYRVGRTRVYRLKTADLMAMFERIDGAA